MPNHDHHCECKHTDVAFCVKCGLVYCKGCKREWQNPCTQSHYNWYTTYTVPTTWPTITTSDSTCEHSNDAVSAAYVVKADGVYKVGG